MLRAAGGNSGSGGERRVGFRLEFLSDPKARQMLDQLAKQVEALEKRFTATSEKAQQQSKRMLTAWERGLASVGKEQEKASASAKRWNDGMIRLGNQRIEQARTLQRETEKQTRAETLRAKQLERAYRGLEQQTDRIVGGLTGMGRAAALLGLVGEREMGKFLDTLLKVEAGVSLVHGAIGIYRGTQGLRRGTQQIAQLSGQAAGSGIVGDAAGMAIGTAGARYGGGILRGIGRGVVANPAAAIGALAVGGALYYPHYRHGQNQTAEMEAINDRAVALSRSQARNTFLGPQRGIAEMNIDARSRIAGLRAIRGGRADMAGVESAWEGLRHAYATDNSTNDMRIAAVERVYQEEEKIREARLSGARGELDLKRQVLEQAKGAYQLAREQRMTAAELYGSMAPGRRRATDAAIKNALAGKQPMAHERDLIAPFMQHSDLLRNRVREADVTAASKSGFFDPLGLADRLGLTRGEAVAKAVQQQVAGEVKFRNEVVLRIEREGETLAKQVAELLEPLLLEREKEETALLREEIRQIGEKLSIDAKLEAWKRREAAGPGSL